MSRLIHLYRSPMTKKAVMAVTGFVLFGFVLGHMLGNLKLYQGPEKLNAYAVFLRTMGKPLVPEELLLWIARLVLLGAVLLHIHAAWSLTRLSRAARGGRYRQRRTVEATYASRTMRWGGVILALFVLYHLMHLTWGNAHADFIPGNVYHNVVAGFQSPLVALIYIAANIALGFHLYHGLWSLFQTLGWSSERAGDWRRKFALVFALVVTLGNVSFPVAVLSGVVGEQPGGATAVQAHAAQPE